MPDDRLPVASVPNQLEIVRRGYDRLSYAYRPDDTPDDHEEYGAWARLLGELVEPGARVLDLGCGCGVPLTRLLSQRFEVTGIDFSAVQIERARGLVPTANFVCADALDVAFDERSFDAVVSFYAIIHMPVEAHAGLFARIARWLAPGGVFLATLGHSAWAGTDPHYLDHEEGLMAWSHADEATNVRWLEAAGLSLEWTRFVPEGDSGHSLVLARRP